MRFLKPLFERPFKSSGGRLQPVRYKYKNYRPNRLMPSGITLPKNCNKKQVLSYLCPSVCVCTAVSDIWSRSKFMNDRSCTLSECRCRQNGRSCTEDSWLAHLQINQGYFCYKCWLHSHSCSGPAIKGLRGFIGQRSLTKCKVWWPQLLPWAGSSSLHGKV